MKIMTTVSKLYAFAEDLEHNFAREQVLCLTMVEQRCVLLLAVLAAGFESSHAASDTYGRYDYDR
jgi:hypothetical protein